MTIGIIAYIVTC